MTPLRNEQSDERLYQYSRAMEVCNNAISGIKRSLENTQQRLTETQSWAAPTRPPISCYRDTYTTASTMEKRHRPISAPITTDVGLAA